MGRGKAWTSEEVAELGRLMGEGRTLYHISQEKGWAYSSVKKAAFRARTGADAEGSYRKSKVPVERLTALTDDLTSTCLAT